MEFIVHKKGIDLETAKAMNIQDMDPLMTCKKFKRFMGRVSYLHSFNLALPGLLEPFHKLLMKYVPFRWGEEQKAIFQKVKDMLESPLTMISPVIGLPLTLYFISTNKCIGTLLSSSRGGRALCLLFE